MSIALSPRAAKLMKLCDLEGYKRLYDLLKASTRDSLCPAICMTEGCDHTTDMEPDQEATKRAPGAGAGAPAPERRLQRP
jgi:hypothetical protein